MGTKTLNPKNLKTWEFKKVILNFGRFTVAHRHTHCAPLLNFLTQAMCFGGERCNDFEYSKFSLIPGDYSEVIGHIVTEKWCRLFSEILVLLKLILLSNKPDSCMHFSCKQGGFNLHLKHTQVESIAWGTRVLRNTRRWVTNTPSEVCCDCFNMAGREVVQHHGV